MAEALITYEDIAERLGSNAAAWSCSCNAAQFPVVKFSKRCHRFRWSEVEAAVAKLTVKAIA